MSEPRPATLITGASAGLGALFARECAARGDEVILVARRRDRLEALAAELGGKAHVLAADLAAPGAGEALFVEAERRGLFVETLINNAGFGLAGRFAALPADGQLEMIDLNVRLLTQLCRLALPPMIARRRGFILNVASTAAFQAGPNMAVYYATKAFVLSLTEALHQEAKGSGVHVTALCPGPTATEFFDVAGAGGGRLAKIAVEPLGVVRAGLAGLARNRAIVVPGAANKVGAQASRFLPRAAMRRIIARIKA
ncbi:MAG TPA: SDR family oxidoreductase [Allosphingosinicella sp.]|nr:SDR family oxidoreductase [Allosphingosinicella sp.]